MTEPDSDDDLMLAFARGNLPAFDALYLRYRKPLYRYLFHAVGDRATADDLYQDVWSRIIAARASFRSNTGFKRWAFRIAHNRLVDHWRQLSRQPAGDGELVDQLASSAAANPEVAASRAERADQLRNALMRLPVEQREAFLLQQEAGLSLADIAEREGVGRETVKSRLRYATARLKILLRLDPESASK